MRPRSNSQSSLVMSSSPTTAGGAEVIVARRLSGHVDLHPRLLSALTLSRNASPAAVIIEIVGPLTCLCSGLMSLRNSAVPQKRSEFVYSFFQLTY
jgi:hypothetical protein